MVEVVAAWIRRGNAFLICQRPPHKARGGLYEFVGGKVEKGETPECALVRECKEELNVTVSVGEVFMSVVHEYPDLTVHLTLFSATIAEGTPQMLEHTDLRWITPSEIQSYAFCPADTELLQAIARQDAGRSEDAVSIRAAKREEAALLTRMSKEAFDTDVICGSDEPGGPPDYDSVAFHEKMSEDGHLFCMEVAGKPVGGIILFMSRRDETTMTVGRIFVDPAYHRRGYGEAAMLKLEQLHPTVTRWRLDTPIWNTRTNRLYTKLGYREVGRDGECIFYEKTK